MIIPEIINAAAVYLDNVRKIGTGEVTLPAIEEMKETIKNAGILGEIEVPIIGQLQSMKTSIKFSTVSDAAVDLMGGTKTITVRAAMQVNDTSAGGAKVQPLTVVMNVRSGKLDLGKLDQATSSDTEIEMEVLSIKLIINNVTRIRIDKLNYIFEIDGVDQLAEVRAALAL